MIVDETIQVTRYEARDTEFTATGGELTVTNPDGTPYGTSPTVTITPGTASTTQILSALITPSQGGIYILKWQYSDGEGETIYGINQSFACWTDPYPLIRKRLQLEESEYPNSYFEKEMASIARSILRTWPVIGNGVGTSLPKGNYGLLTGDDQEWFDEAVALLVCARLVGPISSGGAASDVVRATINGNNFQFADTGRDRDAQDLAPGDPGAGPGGYAGQSERIRWIREAARAIGSISTVQQTVSSRISNFNMFAVSGPTRTALAGGQTDSLMTRLVRLLTDDDVTTYDFPLQSFG